jgi:hypothetical protein
LNTKYISQPRISLFGLGALAALALLPIACGDDSTGSGSGGTAGAAGRSGAAGRAGTAGSAGSGGAKDAGSDGRDVSGDAGASGAGGSAGTTDAGKDSTFADVPPGDTGDSGTTCTNPTDATRGKACLVFTPEQITFADAGPQLDGRGTLFIHVFDTPTPGDTTVPLAVIVYPPPTDAGLGQVSVDALPQIDIDNLPTDLDGSPGNVYIRTLFVDNPLWLQTQKGLTYGLFIGGFNLNNGVQPPPPLRAVPLATGSGTVVRQPLTALRRFTSEVALGTGVTPAGNGQGPMLLGAFTQASPTNALVFGGLTIPCADVTRGNLPVAGYFYSAGGATDFWVGGQLDDFGVGGSSPGGSLISATALGEIPGTQHFTITADQYSVSFAQITLTAVRPSAPDSGDSVSCPVVDGGTVDAGPDVGPDTGPDVGVDATIDATLDVGNDVTNDAASDATNDATSDATGDPASDAISDTTSDSSPADAADGG